MRKEGGKFSFSFIFKQIFKTKFKSDSNSFESLIKPNHHKINMQQHVCTNMFLNLIINFNFMKIFISYVLMSKKIQN